jgi:phage shock protein PspC (stress-responsive transcriptional regulator)
MQKVITINLNGNAYQLDERGYDLLRAYLERAEAQLATNPDKAEIVRDLEQSVAEKCLRHLGPGKTVVANAEVEQMLREIGPIDADSPAPGHGDSGARAGAAAPKRLYQIREGAMISGVCNGIAAYFNVDPTVVRIAFVLAGITLFTIQDDGGAWLVLILMLYVALMFLVPYAKTSEERAAAQGASASIPHTVQQTVERVKAKFG